jgi:hypothetical protein
MTKNVTPAFADDAAVRRIGAAFLDRSLPYADWTHAAHLAVCVWLLAERADIDAPAELPDLIRTYNVAVGGTNTDTAGYHETITQAYIRVVRAFLARTPGGLAARVNALVAAPEGAHDHLLIYWSKHRLFSVEARRAWLEPDLAPLAHGNAGD